MTLPGKAELNSSNKVIRLWAHETCRVFGDRLINNEDRKWMLDMIKSCMQAPFSANFDSILSHLDLDGNNKIETLDEFRGLLTEGIQELGVTEVEELLLDWLYSFLTRAEQSRTGCWVGTWG